MNRPTQPRRTPRTPGQLRIGTGAGMADDRIYPGVKLLERGLLDVLVCECLAERTIARETLNRLRDPSAGYTPMLPDRLRAFLPLLREQGVRLVTNMGSANPPGAARVLAEVSAELGLPVPSCAVVTGDDVLEQIRRHPELRLLENGDPLEALLPRLVSANAYLGADAVARAMATGADVVITGRVADPSLFLGPMIDHYGWALDDWPRLAAGTVAAHLLECSTQVTGGYFADPGWKDVPGLADIGYPLADITADGDVVLGKTPGSGGRLDRMTCTEQLLYEIHDPARYLTPDCTLDLTEVEFEECGPDRVRVSGALGRARPDQYKVVLGYDDGYIGSGEIAFAGINAVARARLAADVAVERFRLEGGVASEIQVDLLGISSLHGDDGSRGEPYEVRVRVAARCADRRSADLIGDEVRQMNMQGPSGPGGPLNHGAKKIIAVQSTLIPRDWATARIDFQPEQSR